MQSIRLRPSLAALWVVFSFSAASIHAQPGAVAATPFELRRGVIVDSGRNAIYLPAPDSSIQAIDLSAGRVLWETHDAALPLTADDSLLVAQGEEREKDELPIAVLDLQTAGRKTLEAVIPLPRGVRALVADEKGRSFRARAELQGNSVVISWTYRNLNVEGVAPPPGERPRVRIVSGEARIDLRSGNVVAMPGGPLVEDPVPPARWNAGNVLASTSGGRGGPVTLKRSDARTGAPLPDRVLVKKGIVALPSAERSHLLASERVGKGGPDDPEYRWTIFSSETGERIGELHRDVSAAPFFLAGGNVVFESRPFGYRVGEVWVDEPLKIRAMRLSQGVPVWEHPVRHLEYRGPVPPAR
jgi:hypothetical protein